MQRNKAVDCYLEINGCGSVNGNSIKVAMLYLRVMTQIH